MLGRCIRIAEKFPSFRWGPLFFATLLTTVNNSSLLLLLLLLSIYRCINGFFPSNCAYSIPLIPTAFQMHDFEKSGKERKTRVSFMILCMSPIINVSSIMRKGKLQQACNPLSRHSYHPPHRSITWLIFKIYRHTLTAKVSGHLDDSNIKQHKDVPCPKVFLSPFKSFFKCTFKVDFMPCTEGHPNKVCSGIKRKKLAMPTTSQYKNTSLLLSEIQEP